MKREVSSVGLMSELKMAMMGVDLIGAGGSRLWVVAWVRLNVVADEYHRRDRSCHWYQSLVRQSHILHGSSDLSIPYPDM
jgi:hypothetical protein